MEQSASVLDRLKSVDMGLAGLGGAVRCLPPSERERYVGLTLPCYQPYLSLPESAGGYAFGLELMGSPVALALGVVKGRHSEVLWVAVSELWQGQQFGARVTAALLAKFHQRGAVDVFVGWVDAVDNPRWTAMVKRLGFKEWRHPQYVCVLDIALSMEVPWLHVNRLGQGFQMMSYANLPPQIHASLPVPGAADDWVPLALRPPAVLPKNQRELSLALVRGDQLVAWVLAERQSDDTTLSRVSYADPSLYALAPIIPLYREYVRHSGEIGAKFVRFTVPLEHHGMARLFQKRIAALAACVHKGLLRQHYLSFAEPSVIPDPVGQ